MSTLKLTAASGIIVGLILGWLIGTLAHAAEPMYELGLTREQVCKPGFAHARRRVTITTKHRFCPAGSTDCIVDHIVPLQLGGLNTLANLQAQTKAQSQAKDIVENRMRARVCRGEVPLHDAQEYFVRRGR